MNRAERAASGWIARAKASRRLSDMIDELEIFSLSTEVRYALREAYMAGVRFQRNVNMKRKIR